MGQGLCDNLVKEIRSFGSVGGNEYVVFPTTYRDGYWDNQRTLMNQLELLSKHVRPKVK